MLFQQVPLVWVILNSIKFFRQLAERFRARLCRGFGGQWVFKVRAIAKYQHPP